MRDKGFEYVAFFDPSEVQGALEAYPELAERQPVENPNLAIIEGLGMDSRSGFFEAYWGDIALGEAGCVELAPGAAFGLTLEDFLFIGSADAGGFAADEDSQRAAVDGHGSCSYFNWTVAGEVGDLYDGFPTAAAIFEGDAAATLPAWQADPDELSPRGASALTVASLLGCTEIMALLIDHGADPDERLPDETPLRAAAWSQNPEAVRLLLDLGADPDRAASLTLNTPLHSAAYLDSAETIAMLLDAGATVDRKDQFLQTPLTAAANGNAADAATALLEAGARLTHEDVETAIFVEAFYFIRAVHEAGAFAHLEPSERAELLVQARGQEFYLPGAQDAIIEILKAAQ